jgi:hypothetical protein
MMLSTLLLTLVPLAGSAPPAIGHGPVAIRVGRAETVSKGVIEHAVILVEDGKIAMIGEDLPVERGIPVLDKPDWVVIPGLVNAYSRMGLDGEAGDESNAEVHARGELYAGAEELAEVVKSGVTTLGIYPPGNGIPGQAVAIRPLGKTVDELVLADGAYLKVILRATPTSKKMLTDGFKKADEYAEKEKKAREKWDKDQEKKKKTPAKKEEKPAAEEKKGEEKKGDEKKGEEKKDEPKPEPQGDKKEEKKDEKEAPPGDTYVPTKPDPKAKPFVDLRNGSLRALVSISSAAEYLHLLDALGKETIGWDLRIPVSRELDMFYVADKKTYDLDVDGIGDRKVRVVVEPVLTVLPGTMRTRNPAAELARAGAKLVLIPRNDTVADHKLWLVNTGELVNAGLDHDVALRALTLEPAEMLGLGPRLGSLDEGKDANMVFLNGDPFEPSTRVQAVMLDGRFVYGEVKL